MNWDLPQWVISLRAGSFAIDFPQLGHRKCFGAKQKTEISNSLSGLYLVPKYFPFPNSVNSIADDPALNVVIVGVCGFEAI